MRKISFHSVQQSSGAAMPEYLVLTAFFVVVLFVAIPELGLALEKLFGAMKHVDTSYCVESQYDGWTGCS